MKPFNYTRRRYKRGGVPIFAGAQGCVFKPSLKCKHRTRNYNDGNISKLGERRISEAEMREYQQIRRHLVRIKNHNKYFGMQAELCEPDALDKHDLQNFDDVCINLKKYHMTAENVNTNLSKLRMINMPDLGIDLIKWMETPMDAFHIRKLNNFISTLLVRAVGPMNRLGVIHNDIKSENVMIDAKGDVRIIDWGLAGISTSQQVIPLHHFKDNPVSFNRPFSTMVISDDSRELYASNVLNHPHPSFTDSKQFAHDLYKRYIESYDIVGFDYFKHIFMSMFGADDNDATQMLMDSVATYNAEILHHFTVHHAFDLNKYFSTVYRYNTDVWGLMSVFYSIFMLPRTHFIMSNEIYENMLRQYRTLFRTVIFANGHKRINVALILQSFRKINAALNFAPKNKTVRFNGANLTRSHNNPIHRVLTPYPHILTIETNKNNRG
jgi:serine/threonine protein kinase